MNDRVKKKLFTFEVRLSRMTGSSSLGDKTYDTISIKGYLKEELKVVSYSLGKEITSSAQVYIDGKDMSKVDAKDLVTAGIVTSEDVFIPLVKDRQILKRENFYRPNSTPEVGVIYLA